MKRIVILDTWTNNTNLGNKIIVEAVYKALREIFPHDFFYKVPALEYLQAGIIKIQEADYVFLAGTNLLSSDMEKTSQWCARPQETFWQNKVILMGLGWWQYQQIPPNEYTKVILNKTLNKNTIHSLRDGYTAKRFTNLGFQGINTGCPTMWWLTEEHCAGIPQGKAEKALLTFTEYNQKPKLDRLLFDLVARNYSTIYFWPQMYGDYSYARDLCGDKLVFIDPSLEALDDVLERENLDYVGTRLHAGIRALQYQRRSLIVGIDNRAMEMGLDFNLPLVSREEMAFQLEGKINGNWATEVRIDKEAIATWKQQFSQESRAGILPAPEQKSILPAPEQKSILPAPEQKSILPAPEQKSILPAPEQKSILPAPEQTSAQELIKQANQALKENQNEAAFKLLNQAKALKQPTEGLDYLRAIYFSRQNQSEAAIQAFNEELRYFPNNATAQNLLKQILEKTGANTSTIDDLEFQELLQIVRPHTMLSEARLYSLFSLTKRICLENIPGNIVECGVAGGGSTALMAAVIKRHSKQTRWLYAFDSFDGMPAPSDRDKHEGIPANATGWGTGTCAAPEANVGQLCSRLGVADLVKTVKGYFQETLPKMRSWVGTISLLHIDGDWYESTQTILENLYDKVGNNCFIQIDDYGYWEGCRLAVSEFEDRRQIKFDLNRIDDTGVWCSCPNKFPINSVVELTLINEFEQDDPVAYSIESQMSLNERFQLYYVLRKMLPETTSPVRFIEIGSYAGSSLFLTCKALKRIAPQLQAFAVEPGGTPQFYEVLKQFTGEVQHLRMLSDRAMPPVKNFLEKDGKFPIFIFIDGDHSYEGVKQDIVNYWPLLAPGGIMMFHDCLPALNDENKEAIFFHHGGKETGIRKACEELMNGYGGEVVDIPLLYPTDPTQTQAHLPIISGVFSTIKAYRKPVKDVKKLVNLESDCVII
ncbi:MAG: TylF/MycF/NovP-related O-methyltransferase [Cyanobacteriota bacterium]|nr:TylF/MycF/NovP-related O-methyltransferase [Cyanobacteriota bacterium]